jgi:uncharacterized protein
LAHVSGIGPSLAKAVVEHREQKGLFRSRQQLLEVPRFSKKSFEQAAGFLRISEGENPLDNTGVHPERYSVLEGLAQRLGKSVRDLMGAGVALVKKDSALKEQIGAYTFDDIVRELEKPGRDPRDQFVPFSYRDDIFEVKDLKPGMLCPGIVTNVTNFGAFVDIGVHQDGLVHISQLSDRFIKDPREAVSPGDHVKVRVLEVNFEKNQISLSMKAASEAAPRGERKPEQRGDRRPERNEGRAAHGGHGGGHGGPRPHGQGGGSGQGPRPSKAPPRPQFTNNPFAGLASLKKDLKSR